jgi:hypothetical protein
MIDKGFYTANAFNLGSILIDLDNPERRENVVFYSKLLRYQKIESHNITFWVNEFGSGISLQKIPGADSFEEAKQIYKTNEYWYPAYEHMKQVVQTTFGVPLKDSDLTFMVDITESKRMSEYSEISILHDHNFGFYLSVFVESVFILQLCRLLDQKLTSLLNQRKSYYAQRVLTEFASSLFTVEKPEGYLPTFQESEYMKELYQAWGMEDRIANLKSKYDLSISNYKFFLEYDEKRQNALTTLLLGSITVFSINQTIPILYEAWPCFNQKWFVLGCTIFALLLALYTFVKYYLVEGIDKLLFRLKNNRLKRRMSRLSATSARPLNSGTAAA